MEQPPAGPARGGSNASAFVFIGVGLLVIVGLFWAAVVSYNRMRPAADVVATSTTTSAASADTQPAAAAPLTTTSAAAPAVTAPAAAVAAPLTTSSATAPASRAAVTAPMTPHVNPPANRPARTSTSTSIAPRAAATNASPRANAPPKVSAPPAPPRKIKDAPPVYPLSARSAGVSGQVVVELTVAPSGKVTDARVIRSVPMLDQAALDAVRKWQYEPTRVNGVAVPIVITVAVNFNLK